MSKLTKLAYNVYEAASISKPPVVLLHGIFGGKQNWRVVAHHLTKSSPRRVYAADLPNHGDSQPRTREMNAKTMCRDVVGFLNEVAAMERNRSDLKTGQRGKVKLELVGHSLGGMISMITAMKAAEAKAKAKAKQEQELELELEIEGSKMNLHFDISKLIIVDISPHRYRREYGAFQRDRNGESSRSVSLGKVLELLNSVDLEKYATTPIVQVRREVDRVLEPLIFYRGLRAFLRTALCEVHRGNQRSVEWQFNLETITRCADSLLNWPQEFEFKKLIDRNIAFDRPMLFLGGSYSDFVNKSDLPELRKVFHDCSMQHIEGAGHWVQADKPLEFVDCVVKFIDAERTD